MCGRLGSYWLLYYNRKGLVSSLLGSVMTITQLRNTNGCAIANIWTFADTPCVQVRSITEVRIYCSGVKRYLYNLNGTHRLTPVSARPRVVNRWLEKMGWGATAFFVLTWSSKCQTWSAWVKCGRSQLQAVRNWSTFSNQCLEDQMFLSWACALDANKEFTRKYVQLRYRIWQELN